MVLLEAMAMSVPVVATDIPGVVDTIMDGVDGRLVPVGDPQALAAALRALSTDRDAARRFARNARKKVERDFTVQRMVHRTHLLYEELIQEKGRGP